MACDTAHDADLVYVTYDKIWFPVFLAFNLCAFVIYKHRRAGLWETLPGMIKSIPAGGGSVDRR